MPDIEPEPRLVANPRDRIQALLAPLPAIGAGATLLALFIHFGETFANGYALELGSITIPSRGFLVFTACWAVFGVPSALFFAFGLARLCEAPLLRERLASLNPPRDGLWMVGAALMSFVVPFVLREALLGGARLTEDEGAYEFMAKVLASGHLSVPSPPHKAHFDINFMVNDGRYYSQYFLGWPALLTPGVLLGIPKCLNAVYSGALVVGLFLVVRRVAGATWARLATVVYLSSVLHMVGAASQLSHTSCAMLLTWLAYAALCSRDSRAPWWIHPLVAALFSWAFFTRPLTAIGVGLPFVVYWGWGVVRQSGQGRRTALIGFGVVSVLGAASFLLVNYLQNGSVFRVAYRAYMDYVVANNYAFAPYAPRHGDKIQSFQFEWGAMFANFAGTLYRMNFGIFGWPSCLLLLGLAWRAPRTGIWWGALGFCLLANLPVRGAGVDTFGPIKLTELSILVLVLTMAGLGQAKQFLERLRRLDGSQRWLSPHLPVALGCSLILVTLIGYVPPRLAAVARVSNAVTLPQRTLEANDVDRALVFTPKNWAPRCASHPTRHFALRRPYNSPTFDDPILWVNHLSYSEDAELRQQYPDRPAYLLVWQKCRPVFVPFETLPAPSE